MKADKNIRIIRKRIKILLVFVCISLAFLSSQFIGCRFARKHLQTLPAVKVPQPVIRVKIKGPTDKILLSIDGNFEIYNSESKIIGHGSRLKDCYCSISSDKLMFANKGIFISDYCDIVPRENGTLKLEHRYYRGSLRIYRVNKTQILAINHVKIEDYLKGVLPGELPERFEDETFKAQAICARTFALYEKYTLKSARKWDVTATEASQVYLGKSVEISKANRAVKATKGIVLTARRTDGTWKIFPTYYSSTCGGWTQSARNIANTDYDIEPLQGGVKCNTCNISPYYRWSERRVSSLEIADALKKRSLLPNDVRAIYEINVLKRTPHGRIAKLELITYNGKRLRISGERFRLIIGSRKMPSTWCDIEKSGKEYIFLLVNGRGLGHGVGMCQYGAEGLARQGRTALEILAHYYPGSKPVRVY